MKSNICDNIFQSVQYWMYKEIQTLANQDTCLTSLSSRGISLVVIVIDGTMTLTYPFVKAIENLAFATINFLGERLGFQSCNFTDCMESLGQVMPFENLHQSSIFYLSMTIGFFKNSYLNLKDPSTAVPIYQRMTDQSLVEIKLENWIEYPKVRSNAT